MAATLNPTPRQSGSGRFRTDVLVFATPPAVVGDVPLLGPNGWTGTPMAGIGAYDFVLRSRADLLAVPGLGVAPAYTLPSGSYVLKNGFSLNAGERLVVPAGAIVKFDGQISERLDGTPGANPLMDVIAGGWLQSRNLVLDTNSPGSQALRTAGTVDLSNCLLDATGLGGQALQMTAGDVIDRGSRFAGGTLSAINQTGGALRLVESIAESGLSSGLSLSGATGLLATCVACSFRSGGVASAVDHQASAGQLEINASLLTAVGAGAHALNIAGALSCVVRGGSMENPAGIPPGAGVRVNGAITQGLMVNGTRFRNLATGVLWVAGVVDRASLIGLDGESSCLVGVDWAAANIPTNGLIELGCQFDVGAPFSNHTQASPRVNRKGCTASGILLSETAIVP